MNIWLLDNPLRAKLERLLTLQKRELVFGDCHIVSERAGFRVIRDQQLRDIALWPSIQVIIAHKRDLITMDLICFDVLLDDGDLIEVNEEMYGFESLLAAMERNLPRFDKRWPDKVVEPPFAANQTVIYSAGSKSEDLSLQK